jgi:RNA polymerase sigma-70 factor (ECF subfamily)
MPYDGMSDEALLERIARRDAAALAALYDRYAPGVLAVAVRAAGNRAAAEAVVERLFWSVWRGEVALDGNTRRQLMLGARRLAERG